MSVDFYRLSLANLRNEKLSNVDPLEISQTPSFYDPTKVIEYALNTINAVKDIEKYEIIEQLIEAAVHVSNLTLAKQYLAEISSKFPDSARVQRLKGLVFEQTAIQKSIKIYSQAIKNDLSDIGCLKRLAMISSRHEAIKILIAHLDTYMQDMEAWTCLAILYIEEDMFSQASFCYEEALLLRPSSHVHMLRYADIQSSLYKLPIALKYYCAVVDTVPECLHGWYGIYTLTTKMIESKIGTKENNIALNLIAKEQITKLYSNATVPSKIVKLWLG
jgi:tetratricopeptide (TPR) repeat protein